MEMHLGDVLGILGAVGYLTAYAALQIRREFAKSVFYSISNFLSALLVAISLLYDFNLAAMIIQMTWMVISGFGIYRCLKYMSSERPEEPGKA
ncbi:MAG: cyclic nucleotide-binding protein [Alphaproteobacteria bacterium]|nr:cyclic nucleotide-binding protein [Alphaproteobacteria bacterium]